MLTPASASSKKEESARFFALSPSRDPKYTLPSGIMNFPGMYFPNQEYTYISKNFLLERWLSGIMNKTILLHADAWTTMFNNAKMTAENNKKIYEIE